MRTVGGRLDLHTLNYARYNHAAELGYDTATDQAYVAVTGGATTSTTTVTSSVEIIFSGEAEWQIGKQNNFMVAKKVAFIF